MPRTRVVKTVKLTLPFVVCIAQAVAQPCTPRWSDDFAHQGLDLAVYTIQGATLQDRPGLYAAGLFGVAGQVSASRIALWNGIVWQDLAGGVYGMVGISGFPFGATLEVFDAENEPNLVVGGTFRFAGGNTIVSSVARWSGSVWSSVGGGIGGENCTDCPTQVASSTVYDLGNGPRLYVGGSFLSAGSARNVNNIASWDGQEWSALGSGLEGFLWFPAAAALQGYDGTGSPNLYVGGFFFGASGKPLEHFARWDGTDWHDVGGGLTFQGGPLQFNPGINAIAVFDDGLGESLYAGGSLTEAGNAALKVSGIARWDGAKWFDVGGGVTLVAGGHGHIGAMAVFDDGTGPALYVGGVFEFAGGVPARNIARWDGNEWSALGLGLDDGVRTLTVYDLGDGEALYIGGDFLTAGGMPSAHIAKWVGCKQLCPACVCDFDTTTGPKVCDIFDFLAFQNEFVSGEPCAIDLDTTTGPGVADIFDFLAFQNAFVTGCK